jgi:Na+/melibiose symporter-like transporter
MGISPLYIGLALSASRIIDAVTDPLMGNITDNTKSRWGRRRPYVFIGAILMSVIFATIWFTPRSGSEFLQAAYLIITCSLFYMAFTVWVIPYSGLGLEMVVDYDERTRLMTFRVLPSYVVGVAIASLYKITLMENIWGGDEVVGARYVCSIVAALMLITAIIPSLLCKERYAEVKQEKLKLWRSITLTIQDKPFLLLVGSVFFVFVSLFFMIPLLTYISLYFVCQGDKELVGTIGVYTVFVQMAAQILGTAAIGIFAKYFDKKHVLITGLIIGILGYLSSWLLFTPTNPYLIIIPPVIINIGLCACWVLNGSFSADICDYDELKTGRRREGMYSAVFGFLNKAAIALVMAVSSWVLVQLGFEGEDLSPTVQQLFSLRLFYIVVPVVAMIGAILCMWKYPLTKARVNEIQEKLLEIRRADKAL